MAIPTSCSWAPSLERDELTGFTMPPSDIITFHLRIPGEWLRQQETSLTRRIGPPLYTIIRSSRLLVRLSFSLSIPSFYLSLFLSHCNVTNHKRKVYKMHFSTLIATSAAAALAGGASAQVLSPNATIARVHLYGDSGCTNATNSNTQTALFGGIGLCYGLHFYPAPANTVAIKIDYTDIGTEYNCACTLYLLILQNGLFLFLLPLPPFLFPFSKSWKRERNRVWSNTIEMNSLRIHRLRLQRKPHCSRQQQLRQQLGRLQSISDVSDDQSAVWQTGALICA